MKAIVLLSGGIDSMACAYFYISQKYETEALFVDYAQPALQQERHAAERIAAYLCIPLKIITVPKMHVYDTGEIFGRNAVLALQALAAYGKGTYKVITGIHSGTIYSDCSEDFIVCINRVFDIYTNGTIILEAPFASWTKQQIISYCLSEALPISITYSCESSGVRPCGKCKSCLDRKEFLNESY